MNRIYKHSIATLVVLALLTVAVISVMTESSHDAYAQKGGDQRAAQGDSDRATQCMAMIRSMMNGMNRVPEGDSVCYIDYVLRVVMRDSSVARNSSTTIDMVMGRERMSMVSSEFELYQDSLSAFAVIPATRTIYRSDPIGRIDRERRANYMLWMQDTLLIESRVVEFSDTSRRGETLRRVVLEPSARARGAFGLARYTVTLDTAQKRLIELEMEPTGGDVATMRMTFGRIEIASPPVGFDRPVLSRVLDRSGNLLDIYNGYRLVDNRAIAGR